MADGSTHDFLAVARELGQDCDALERGEIVRSKVEVKSLAHFKQIFAGHLTDEQREAHSANAAALPGSANAGEALMHEIGHHVYGTHELSPAAKVAADQLFPVHADVTSGSKVTINTDESFGPSAAPVLINAGTVEFNGGSVTAITTSLTIIAGTLNVVKGGSKPYIVGVLGTDGGAGDDGKQGPAYSDAAQAGHNSSAPTPGICTGAGSGGDGSDGSTGNKGQDGTNGDDGQPNLPATIQIDNLDPSSKLPFVVFTQSGGGGKGGNGGKGGTGQTGGRGGNGCDSGCEGTDGGKGGNAGAGGQGGNGGNGGNGVAGAQISITFPSASKSLLQTTSQAAAFGKGGDAGPGGDAGSPGSGGSGGKHKSNGSGGGGASAGDDGKSGDDGTKTGAPGNFQISYT